MKKNLLKKPIYLILIFVLMFSFTACNSDNDKNAEKQEQKEVQKESENNNGNENEDSDAEKKDNSNSQAEDDKKETEEKENLKSLKDVDLMKSFINHKQAENYYYKALIKSNDRDLGEVEFELINYTMGDSIRTESDFDGEHTVMIFNAEEGALYNYTVGELQGTKTIQMEATKDEMFDTSLTYEEYEDFADLIKAEYSKLNGDDVIYIEQKDKMDGVEKIWYSIDKHFPIKFVHENADGTMMSEFTVIEFEEGIFKEKFIPDDEITFVE